MADSSGTYFLPDNTYNKHYIHKAKPSSDVPPRSLMQYGESIEVFLSSGEKDFEFIEAAMEDVNFSFKGSNILEFGCSNARVLRHFMKYASTSNIWGCDINSGPITWCQENLSPPFNFFVNTTQPHLPLTESYFNLIFAYSIFTHIDDLFFTWFLELKRVTAMGSYLYITMHDENSVRFGFNNPTRIIGKHITSNKARFSDLLDGKLNVLAINRDHFSQVFLRRDYIVARLESMGLKTISITENTMGGHQSAYLLQKIK